MYRLDILRKLSELHGYLVLHGSFANNLAKQSLLYGLLYRERNGRAESHDQEWELHENRGAEAHQRRIYLLHDLLRKFREREQRHVVYEPLRELLLDRV